MNFEASRAKAIDKLNNFVEKNLSDYSRLRNFDFGPDKRDNVSCLSPYVTHGVLNEIEIIKKSLAKFSFSKNEKFIQEVLWRTYWKGWLELRPNVWSDYLISLNSIREKFKDNKDYIKAIESALEVRANMELMPLQPGDVIDTFADVKDLITDFNYRPSISINEGVLRFIEWYKQYYKA